jgi:hypothetical protein
MHFSRDCCRGLVAPTFGRSVLVRQPGGTPPGRSVFTTRTHQFSAIAPCMALPSERRTAASMQSSARWFRDAGPLVLRPRPTGHPLTVVSAALRLLALIAMDGMYVCLFRLMAPTVGASLQGCNQLEQCRSNCRGAKKQVTKKSLFLETPFTLIEAATFFRQFRQLLGLVFIH